MKGSLENGTRVVRSKAGTTVVHINLTALFELLLNSGHAIFAKMSFEDINDSHLLQENAPQPGLLTATLPVTLHTSRSRVDMSLLETARGLTSVATEIFIFNERHDLSL